MKTTKFALFILSLGLFLSCSEKTTITPSASDIIGKWTLLRITSSFTPTNQPVVIDAVFSETLEYKSDGTYHRLITDINGQREEKGSFAVGPNSTKTFEKQAIFYPDDKTTQPYTLQDGHLFLYQRGPQEVTIANGSTYEYKRQ